MFYLVFAFFGLPPVKRAAFSQQADTTLPHWRLLFYHHDSRCSGLVSGFQLTQIDTVA